MNDKKRVILARCVVLQGAQLCLSGIGLAKVTGNEGFEDVD